ncbi:MAG: uridine kinase [Candidatus Aenigmarchaeota archaeon]|nr:uridine kinase [Candidatus Aenigmarchaeota archaeon]MBI4994742.1 uridine kinase [Candidatus Peregrinibacteria bacterium]
MDVQQPFPLLDGIREVMARTKEFSSKQPVTIVAIAGGSGAGKTFISRILQTHLPASIVVSMDSYYRPLAEMPDNNFDTPTALDLSLLSLHLRMLKEEKTIQQPVYDMTISDRVGFAEFHPRSVIILEGMFALHEAIRDVLDMRVFVETQPQVRLQRRMKRDIVERKRTKESVLTQWKELTYPMHQFHVQPQRSCADIIIHNNETTLLQVLEQDAFL